jgi:class 3 adenylate cyclase
MRMADYVGAFLDEMYRVVKREGGVIGSYNGDGALAVFEGRDRADRAVAAAVRLQHRMVLGIPLQPIRSASSEGPFSWEQSVPFPIGAGVDLGEVVPRTVGFGEMTGTSWIGRCTNTAEKLSKRADAIGSVAITDEVLQSLSGRPELPLTVWKPAECQNVGGEWRAVHVTNAVRPEPRSAEPHCTPTSAPGARSARSNSCARL